VSTYDEDPLHDVLVSLGNLEELSVSNGEPLQELVVSGAAVLTKLELIGRLVSHYPWPGEKTLHQT
jgi:hypothetical protein